MKDVDCGVRMTTYTGMYVDPRNLSPSDISILDIAQGLSNCCRFAGQCTQFYSVAQHSTIMAREFVNDNLGYARVALLHDAPEAYLGDLVRCVKTGLPDYQGLEDLVWGHIVNKFDLADYLPLSNSLPAKVKELDERMVVTERKYLISDKSVVWDLELKHSPITGGSSKILPTWSPDEARKEFLKTFFELFPFGIT